VKEMIKVKAPATSANLGPGYDSFGLALNLFNEYQFKITNNLKLKIEIKDNQQSFVSIKKEDNLILKTIEYMKQKHIDKIKTDNLEIKVKLNYPINRGLGSSANAIIAVICGLNKLYTLNLNTDQILNYALKLEGHPDNIVPTLLGGFSINKIEDDCLSYEIFKLSPKINTLLFIPEFPIKTAEARRVIEDKISINKVIKNIANASLITSGLIKNDIKLLKKGSKDYIHQNKRLRLNDNLNSFFKKMNIRTECPFFLSGSGSTIIFFSDKEFSLTKKIIKNTAEQLNISYDIKESKINNEGIIINRDRK